MNRRNFLKLFGIFAVPSSVLALPAPKPQKGMIVITVEIPRRQPIFAQSWGILPVTEKYRIDTGYVKSDWIDFCPTTWDNLSSSNAWYYGDDKEITVEFSNGYSISFEPDWNPSLEEFDSITVVKHNNGIDVFL